MKTIIAIITLLYSCTLLALNTSASDRPKMRNELPMKDRLTTSLTELTDIDPAALDSFIIDYMDENNIPGLAASIVKDGEVIWTGAFGNAYFVPWIPNVDSTLFMLASISKTITATALMKLYEQGQFELDDPVSDYLPFPVVHPRYPSTDITFHMILTHTSGIEDNWSVMPYYPGDSPIPLGEYLENYLVPGGSYYNQWLNFSFWEPGTGYSYCNNAVALAGYLVEVISGMPFDDYCELNVFEPLQMSETAWFLADLDTMQVAMPYHWNGNTYIPYGHFGYSDYPSGQLRTSAPQLLRFLTAYMQYGLLDTVRILDSTTVAMMTTPQIPQIDPSQGLIWYSNNLGGRFVWGHGGGDLGVTTEMYYCPEENSGVVALSNGESFFFDIVNALFDYAELYNVTLTIDLTPHDPPIQIPAGGGQFTYDILIENSDTITVTMDVWIEAQLPNGATTPPLIQRSDLSLVSGGVISRENLSQSVPAAAPPGEYVYFAHLGQYPGVVAASDSFTFTKSAAGDGTININDWSISAWDEEESPPLSLPASHTLLSVYPNPFNPTTTISFSLPVSSENSLIVYDVFGREVARLADGFYESGTHEFAFPGEALTSGVYFAKLISDSRSLTRKLLLLK